MVPLLASEGALGRETYTPFPARGSAAATVRSTSAATHSESHPPTPGSQRRVLVFMQCRDSGERLPLWASVSSSRNGLAQGIFTWGQ